MTPDRWIREKMIWLIWLLSGPTRDTTRRFCTWKEGPLLPPSRLPYAEEVRIPTWGQLKLNTSPVSFSNSEESSNFRKMRLCRLWSEGTLVPPIYSFEM